MARTSSSRSRKEVLAPVRPSFFESLSPHTKQAIGSITLIVFGVLFILAYYGLAGRVGEYTQIGLGWLFGYGYALAPLLCFSYAILLLRPELDDHVSTPKIIGIAFLYSSILGFLTLLMPAESFMQSGGALGYIIAQPLNYLLGDLAASIILGAFLLVGIFLTFNTGFVRPAFLKKREEEEYEDEEIEEPAAKAAIAAAEIADENTEEDEEDTPKKSLTERIKEKVTPAAALKDELVMAEQFVSGPYTPPSLKILKKDSGKAQTGDVKANANIIKRALKNFNIPVELDEVSIGPSVTRYAIKPAEGVRLSKIVGLRTNLELALAASPVRIEAPIPGKSLVGIEVPNSTKSMVGLASLLASPEYTDNPKPLMVALGRDITGKAHFVNVAKMPHCLIAGTTGSGKSVTIHAIIMSLLFRNPPDLLKFIMIDPKRVELTLYNGIPHLLTPVITDPKKAVMSLKWAVNEMTRRYDILQSHKVRDVGSYHENIYAKAKAKWEKEGSDEEEKAHLPEPLPYIVIVADELADLMSSFPKELEASIVRLAQMSRAVGIHLLLATQRPSVNVVTGLIKANVPSRLALQVASQVDSKTILDQVGAETLLGQGDMLFLGGELSKPVRLQSAYVSEEEVKAVVDHLKKQAEELGLSDTIRLGGEDEENDSDVIFSSGTIDTDVDDDLYEEAVKAVIDAKKASTSYLQRKLSVGYGRAAKLIDLMEQKGVVGPANGSKPRDILIGGGGSGDMNEEEL
ncbi:hypothetical protein A3C87_01595 [Candidatus Kaiserbacteria bacterium RIFCSPHIGHO2_02_FULL_49_34]|uniref:FtsK domain-containing protein n=1 Tax=Candidatus Kaiserbacteria bacterium RIFCSPHIGHO2_02_FULL_49_34 TaxID=1798491 RepID=A0A1F6DIQ0_9BACT|nr:MAG: hypothetical protein A3C87_01595 [Candidatus Kaiserbacteria bacterium RIFCSPHIGHO2_02_FULL_49_34]